MGHVTPEEGVEFAPETRRLISARHEAAHAVIAHAQGVRVESITIDEAEAREATRESRYRDNVAGCVREMGTLLENARISIAGPIQAHADEDQFSRALGKASEFRYEGADNDIEAWQMSSFKAAAGDRKQAATLMKQTYAEVAKTLGDRNDAWNALYTALAERGRLEGDEILAILGPYPEVSPETLAEREATRVKHRPAE